MRLVANSILVTLILSVIFVTFSNFILFFPWYLTLVYETYHLSVQSAAENYISSQMIRDVREDLSNRPIYKRMGPGDIEIFMDDVKVTEQSRLDYKQRGQTFTVAIQCRFPFEVRLSGIDFRRDIAVKFQIPTTGLKFYKDLPS